MKRKRMRRFRRPVELIRGAAAVLLAGCFLFIGIPVLSLALGEWESSGFLAGEEDEKGGSVREISYADIPEKIKIWNDEKGRYETVSLEDYVCCVTSVEMPLDFEEEALKAQAVAARTYAVSKALAYERAGGDISSGVHPEAPLCTTTHCQAYSTKNMKDERWKRVEKACRETEGEVLFYGDQLVSQPLYFSSSGGQTENSEDVFANAYPYLVSVSSPYEEEATHQNEEKAFTYEELAGRFEKAYPLRDTGNISMETIKIISRTSGGRVYAMQIGDGSEGIYKGTEVRSALGLSSTMFSTHFVNGKVVFLSDGSGHGVGMSQYGAHGMAAEGYDYREILSHYYRGTEVRGS